MFREAADPGSPARSQVYYIKTTEAHSKTKCSAGDDAMISSIVGICLGRGQMKDEMGGVWQRRDSETRSRADGPAPSLDPRGVQQTPFSALLPLNAHPTSHSRFWTAEKLMQDASE